MTFCLAKEVGWHIRKLKLFVEEFNSKVKDLEQERVLLDQATKWVLDKGDPEGWETRHMLLECRKRFELTGWP